MRFAAAPMGLALSIAMACVGAASADAWKPPPGEYRVDTVTTTRWQTPTGVLESIEEVNGDTGQSTVTRRSPGVAAPVVTTVPGQGPVRQCQIIAAPPSPRDGGCQGQLSQQGGAAAANLSCAGQGQHIEFRKLSEGVWEKRVRLEAAAPQAPVGAMPPEAQAAMASMLAKMEARAKQAPPAEAAALRQQMAAMQRSGGGTPNAPEVEMVQRWTWLSNQCMARR